MELEDSIYCFSRDGKLDELKRLLDDKPREVVEMLVSLETNGATPLAIACHNGHLDVALYLLQECKADVEQVCSVIIDGKTVEDAPPLWLAARAGHLTIVKTLVSYKASVNSTTKTSSTPLRASCFEGHFEIAKYLVQHGADIEIANKRGHTCLMIACSNGHYEIAEMLIQNGANINRKCPTGNTVLHECAESGSLEILKLLLERGAECACDSYGNTPLMCAAVSGNDNIVEYFFEVLDCSKLDKANALELLSAACMDEKQDIKALAYWKRAMIMRYEDSEFRLEKSTKHTPLASYINAVEICNFEQLEELFSDPDKANVQALLVRERILGPGNPYTHLSLRNVGANFAANNDFYKCIKLWLYDLELQQGIQEPISPQIQDHLSAFVELFSEMMSQDLYLSAEHPAALFKDIFSVFKSALKEIQNEIKSSETRSQDLMTCSPSHCTLVISLHLIGLMCELLPNLTKTEELELKGAVYKLVLMDPRTRTGCSLLHLACNEESSTIGRYSSLIDFPSPQVVDLLLEVGAGPNAMDLSGSTPLHVIAKKSCSLPVFEILLNYGAHLDFRNSEGKTALDIDQNSPLLDVNPLQYINLQCLSAQVVRSDKIPYRGLVTKRLENFLDMH